MVVKMMVGMANGLMRQSTTEDDVSEAPVDEWQETMQIKEEKGSRPESRQGGGSSSRWAFHALRTQVSGISCAMVEISRGMPRKQTHASLAENRH